jgi:hypothetical protein
MFVQPGKAAAPRKKYIIFKELPTKDTKIAAIVEFP